MIQHSRVMTIPPILSVRHRAPAAAVPWWLSGGVAAGNAVAVYQPIRSASLAASYVNLANPGTYNAAPGVAPTFNAATGWTFNGSTQYLTTGVTPVSQTWSLLVRVSSLSLAAGYYDIIGCTSGGRYFGLQITSAAIWYLSGGYTSFVPSTTAGVVGIAGNVPYRDGTAEAGTIPANAGALAAITIATIDSKKLKGNMQAVAIYNTTLTAPQVAAISAAMVAL